MRTNIFSGLLRAAAVSIALSSSAFALDITPFEDTSSLVSIGGSLTEIIYALGEEGRLIARDSTGTFPAAAEALPDVGYMRALSPEGVLSVNPSALLVIDGSGPPEVLDVLADSGVPYQTVPNIYTAEGILTKVAAVGAALGVDEKAAVLSAQLKADLAAAEAATSDIKERKRILFILSTRGGKINAAGLNNAANGIITMAGAVNAIQEYEGYKALTEEAIINAKPDYILMMDRGDHGAVDDELFGNPAIALTPAGQNRAVIRLNGSYLLGFGPRTASAVRDLATALYGHAVKPE